MSCCSPSGSFVQTAGLSPKVVSLAMRSASPGRLTHGAVEPSGGVLDLRRRTNESVGIARREAFPCMAA
jgi:hypothetical protein